MAELTRLLSDIYGSPPAAETETEEIETEEIESFSDSLPQPAPIWESEDQLDEIFSAWNPGPDQYASAEEHELVAEPFTADAQWAPVDESVPVDSSSVDSSSAPDPFEPFQSFAHAESDHHWSAHVPEAPFTDVNVPGTQIQTGWTRHDDDLLPSGVAKRGLSFFRR